MLAQAELAHQAAAGGEAARQELEAQVQQAEDAGTRAFAAAGIMLLDQGFFGKRARREETLADSTKRAMELAREAAKDGDLGSTYLVFTLYVLGERVPNRDRLLGVNKWLHEAEMLTLKQADEGDAIAMGLLCWMYGNNSLGLANRDSARLWRGRLKTALEELGAPLNKEEAAAQAATDLDPLLSALLSLNFRHGWALPSDGELSEHYATPQAAPYIEAIRKLMK